MSTSNSRPRLTVLGTGYLGTTHAACMAELGYEVLGIDTDAAKIAKLQAGQVPFHEPGLDELLVRALDSGRLRFTTDVAEAAEVGDVHFVCVGTPQRADSPAADTSYVEAVVRTLGPLLRRKALVVGKSTVPVGTAAWVERTLVHLAPGDVEVAWNPEFLREGFAIDDTMRPDRLVFGVKSQWARETLDAAYQGVYDLAVAEGRQVPVVACDFATAELVKVAANAFLATKISFVNAMAEVCEAAGADVAELSRALGYDARIGNQFLRAGIGFGGGCLPKDIRAFAARADELGVGSVTRLLSEVDEINLARRHRAVDLTRQLLDGQVHGAQVAILGAAFKPNSDDVRDSPALWIAQALVDRGAHVAIYDPQGSDNARAKVPAAQYHPTALDAAAGADVVCVLTEWAEFVALDPAELATVVAHPRVVDGRNCLDATRWRAAGWTYRGLGRH